MSDWLEDFRSDLTRMTVGLASIALIVAVVVVADGAGVAVPVGFVLLPALGVALVAGPGATAVVSLAATIAIAASYVAAPVGNEPARLASVVCILGLATAASEVRRRRERALVAHAELVALARDHDRTARITQDMMERIPELAEARDIPGVARRAVRVGRAVFGASACSYWQVEGDDCVLLARDPAGPWSEGHRMPVAMMAAHDHLASGSRTSWVSHDSAVSAERRAVMEQAGAGTGTSTPIRVDGRTVAYLALTWIDAPDMPSASWFALLDRFGDQVALAKTVVRRRIAQDQAQRLGARLQSALLPRITTEAGEARVRTLYRPGTRDLLLGGDFLDVVSRPDGRDDVAFLIGDVSGHGPEQAAVAASLRSAWKAMSALPDLGLADWSRGLDFVLSEQSSDSALFVTLIMGTADVRGGSMEYVTAGHPPPVLLAPGRAEEGPFGGPPLGVVPAIGLPVHTLKLGTAHAVLMVTDGIFEGRHTPTSHERVGWDDFVLLLAENDDEPTSPSYLERLAEDMTRRNGGPMSDDVAALLLLLPQHRC